MSREDPTLLALALAAGVAPRVALAACCIAGGLNRICTAVEMEDCRSGIGDSNAETEARQRLTSVHGWFLYLLVHSVRPLITLPIKMGLIVVLLKR